MMRIHFTRASGALLMLALSSLALPAAAQRLEACRLVSCSASGLQPSALAAPTRVEAGRPVPGRTSAMPGQGRSADPVRDPWEGRLQGRTQENDVCLLNVGIGAELARKGVVSTHALGQVWKTQTGAAR